MELEPEYKLSLILSYKISLISTQKHELQHNQVAAIHFANLKSTANLSRWQHFYFSWQRDNFNVANIKSTWNEAAAVFRLIN